MTDPLPSLRWSTFWWTAFALAQVVLVISSMIPLPDDPFPVEHWDKWGHIFAHLGLAAMATLVCRTPRSRWLALIWLLLLGALIEGLQGLVPWRSMEAADLLANATGTVLGGLLALTPLRDGLVWLEHRLLSRGA